MSIHVFVVDERTFKLHLEYMFAGTGAKDRNMGIDKKVPFLSNPDDKTIHYTTERMLTGMIADVSRIREGDKVIFYLQSNGDNPGKFYGVFRAASAAFFDENDENNYLGKELDKGLCFRIQILPDEVYSLGITEHEYLDSLEGKEKPYEMCWSMIYRKLKANRGCTMITDYEFEDLRKKLNAANEGNVLRGSNYTYNATNKRIELCEAIHAYKGRKNAIDIVDRMVYKAGKRNAFETHLQAYIMQNFDKSPLAELLLPLPNKPFWIGNEVSCGVGMQRIDVVLWQQDEKDIYFKVIELKDEEPRDSSIVHQLYWYLEWLSYYVIPNYKSLGKTIHIIPCIIAKKPRNEKKIENIKKEKIVCKDKTVIVWPIEYIGFSFKDKKIIFSKL